MTERYHWEEQIAEKIHFEMSKFKVYSCVAFDVCNSWIEHIYVT